MANFPGGSRSGWSIPRCGRGGGWTRGGVFVLRRKGRSKLSSAHRVRMKLMPQFQAQVPYPLRDQLPALLPAGGVTTPAVGIKLVVFIAESWLEGATMQIQLDHIGNGESLRWHVGEEEFVDCTRPRHANGTLLLARRMSCDHHAAAAARWSHWDVGAIVEDARHLTFRATLLSIRRQMQPGLHAWVIQYGVVLAPRHKRVACQIREDRSRAIGSIQARASHAAGGTGVQSGRR